MKRSNRLRSWALALLLCGVLASVIPATARGQCAMCRANLEAAGHDGMHTMNAGVLMLILPTLGMIACIGIVVYRNKD